MGLFGQGHVKTQAEEMEELRQKTSLTADEFERLARATAVGDKVKQLRSGKTEEEQKTEDAVSKAIVEAGSRNVAQGVLKNAPELVDSQGDAAVAKSKLEDLQKRYESNKKLQANDTTGASFREGAELKRQIDQAKLDQLEARRKTAEELAATGALPSLFPGGLPQLQGLVDKDPNAFGPNGRKLGKDLKASGPEGREEAEQEKAEAAAEKFHQEAEAKRAEWEAKGQEKEDEEDRKAEEHFQKQQQANAEKQAKWDVVDGPKQAEDAARKAKEDAEKARKDAVQEAEKRSGGTGLDARTDDAFLRYALRSGGHGEAAQKALEAGLKREFLGRGMNEEQASIAAKEKAGERSNKVADEINGNLASPQMHAPQRIGTSDFARSVESAGAADSKKQLEQMVAMRASLADLVRQGQQGPGPPPDPALDHSRPLATITMNPEGIDTQCPKN
jgi:hypothetical protein